MIGEKTSTLLRQLGIRIIKTLSEIPVELLTNMFGKNGMELWRRANGIDETPVTPYREQKSISTENTFETDTINVQFLNGELVRMTQKIAFELRKQNKLTGCITVKIRYSNFDTVTKQIAIPYTSADHLILPHVKELFNKLYDRRMLIRLIGVRFSHLIPGNYQINLFQDSNEMIKLYQALDSVNHQYGRFMIMRASGQIKI